MCCRIGRCFVGSCGVVVMPCGGKGEAEGAVIGRRSEVDGVADDVVEFDVFCRAC
jgi:hypothetical protein